MQTIIFTSSDADSTGEGGPRMEERRLRSSSFINYINAVLE